jgi:hypothetical protein
VNIIIVTKTVIVIIDVGTNFNVARHITLVAGVVNEVLMAV